MKSIARYALEAELKEAWKTLLWLQGTNCLACYFALLCYAAWHSPLGRRAFPDLRVLFYSTTFIVALSHSSLDASQPSVFILVESNQPSDSAVAD